MPIRFLKTFSEVVTALLLLILALMTLIDVVGRNWLNAPLPGSTEITEYVLVGVTFLLYPYVAYQQKHITVDVFDAFTGPRVRRAQQMLAGFLGAAVFAVLTHRMWSHADRLLGYGDVTIYLEMPVAYTYYFMSIMSGVTTASFIGSMFTPIEEIEKNLLSPKNIPKPSQNPIVGAE